MLRRRMAIIFSEVVMSYAHAPHIRALNFAILYTRRRLTDTRQWFSVNDNSCVLSSFIHIILCAAYERERERGRWGILHSEPLSRVSLFCCHGSWCSHVFPMASSSNSMKVLRRLFHAENKRYSLWLEIGCDSDYFLFFFFAFLLALDFISATWNCVCAAKVKNDKRWMADTACGLTFIRGIAQ